MFPQFASTARSITRATALLTRVGTDANLYDDPETEDFSVLLDSKYEAEKIEGMKRLIALMSQGRDVSNFFPQVLSILQCCFQALFSNATHLSAQSSSMIISQRMLVHLGGIKGTITYNGKIWIHSCT